MHKASAVIKDLMNKKSPEKALILQQFFKTKKGEYAEGDIFDQKLSKGFLELWSLPYKVAGQVRKDK